eukprot:Tamp_03385.p1 GENE.Tamp_03385~~Tamp_03385.p1  ORF type:complete len:712 (-),score=14.75 Tamp_03385:1610-3745(-)
MRRMQACIYAFTCMCIGYLCSVMRRELPASLDFQDSKKEIITLNLSSTTEEQFSTRTTNLSASMVTNLSANNTHNVNTFAAKQLGPHPYQWIHPQKTGSSFANALFALTCPEQHSDIESSRTHDGVSKFEVQAERGIPGIGKRCRSKWVKPHRPQLVIGDHYSWSTNSGPSSTFVSLRSPANRLRSWVAFYGGSAFRCESLIGKSKFEVPHAGPGFSKWSYLHMLSDVKSISESSTLQACQRLSRSAWIGLTDYFEASVCLLHHMHPHAGHPKEMWNMRPTKGVRSKSITDDSCPSLFQKQAAKIFPHDKAIYLCGVSKFVQDIRDFAPSCGRLVQAISPYEYDESRALLNSLLQINGSGSEGSLLRTSTNYVRPFDKMDVQPHGAVRSSDYMHSNARSCATINFIHIGKTGGTYLESLLDKQYELKRGTKMRLKAHSHSFLLGDAKSARDCYTFFVRDPVERWVSGFLSRMRLGCPSHCHYVQTERLAFVRYPTPNALAEALCTSDNMAYWAENAIEHTRHAFTHYLPDLEQNLDKIVFVGSLSNFTADAHAMIMLAGDRIPVKTDKWQRGSGPDQKTRRAEINQMHQNPASLQHYTQLSIKARCILEEWLSGDFDILDKLKERGLIKESFPRKCAMPKGSVQVGSNRSEFPVCRQGHKSVVRRIRDQRSLIASLIKKGKKKLVLDTIKGCDCQAITRHLEAGDLWKYST